MPEPAADAHRAAGAAARDRAASRRRNPGRTAAGRAVAAADAQQQAEAATSTPPKSKPDPKQDPPIEPVAATPAPAPVAQLRTPATPTGPEAIRQIREILDNTQKMLDSVQPPLSDDRKANLTSARALMQQSEEALRKEELTQARSFAERALNIAKVLLSGR